jgi:hypothetical protein
MAILSEWSFLLILPEGVRRGDIALGGMVVRAEGTQLVKMRYPSH